MPGDPRLLDAAEPLPDPARIVEQAGAAPEDDGTEPSSHDASARSDRARRAAARLQRRRVLRRRRAAALGVAAALTALLAAALVEIVTLIDRPAPAPPLTPLQRRIVTIAESQLGYRTDPPDTYCNRYSAFWGAGAVDCGAGLRDEEWCADFAAWVWRRAGVQFAYGGAPGEIDAASASFVVWGELHGTWHAVGSSYLPQPGDVAVYGYDPLMLTAAHVAVVTGYEPGARGPDVVNGDGDRSAFSAVETGTDQWKAQPQRDGELLSGYVAPMAQRSAARQLAGS